MAQPSCKPRHPNNLRNAAVALLVPLPSLFFYLSFLRRCSATESPDSLSPLWAWCYHHPLLLANALFFLNVNLLFRLVDDRFVLDAHTCNVGTLLRHSPNCRIQCFEIEARDSFDLDLVVAAHSQLLPPRKVAVECTRRLEI
ncbi:hypothetical protein SASPL_133395 [Salvia splendens]|uniref:Uncharacterized protein n=1 Tax=Salvia splendens TaxID=180675 RepID=A0A8X8X2M2_SALSN|nr:hypothetical protein SASPL_133395 [Salvia splendens]